MTWIRPALTSAVFGAFLAHAQGKAVIEETAALIERGRYLEARDLATRTLAAVPLGSQPCAVASVYYLQALADNALGRHREAETALRLGLAPCEAEPDRPAPVIVGILVAIAESEAALGRGEDAGRTLHRALSIAEARLPPDHPRTAELLTALGRHQSSRGLAVQAEANFRRSIAILERNLGPSHPDVASQTLPLASLLLVQGREREALPLIERSRRLLYAARGPYHPDSVFATEGLAVAMLETKPAEAEALLREALSAWLTRQPESHSAQAQLWNALGVAQYRQRRPRDAAKSAARALAILRVVRGLTHPQTLLVMDNYAHFLRAARRKKEAAAVQSEADQIRKAHGIPPPARYTIDIRSFGRSRSRGGR